MKENIKTLVNIGALAGVLATSQIQANESWFNGYVGYNNKTENSALRIEGGWDNDFISTYGHIDLDKNNSSIQKFGGLDIALGKGPLKLEHEFRTTGDLNFHRTGFKIDCSLGNGNYTSVAYYPFTQEDSSNPHFKMYMSQDLTGTLSAAFLLRKESGFEYFEPEANYLIGENIKLFVQGRGTTEKLDSIIVGLKGSF